MAGNYHKFIRPCLFALPPEAAHNAAITALSLLPTKRFATPSATKTTIAGLAFPSAVGLAAGFDKNARALAGCFGLGAGFVEAGTVTLNPQAGNPKPRLFRLDKESAIVNRMGFNNDGAEAILARIAAFRKKYPDAPPLGINVGLNKERVEHPEDYREIIALAYPLADYITVNISSPNTPGLRDLQHADKLAAVLDHITAAKTLAAAEHGTRPVFVKIAPDIEDGALSDLAALFLASDIDGVILGNTTVSRPEWLESRARAEQGGLSGKPLAPLALHKLAVFYKASEGKIPLIACGGISSGEEAFARILHGASAVQIYSCLIYDGPAAINNIASELGECLARHGFKSLEAACGYAAS